VDALLYNCAVVFAQGRILGVVPKTYLPNYREFYERRQFTPGDSAVREVITLGGQRDVPFGSGLLFRAEEQPLLTFFIEICEDLWVPVPPSSYAALAGATVLLNLSASNITVGKADYRRQLVMGQAARCLAAYLYSAAGPGESTTDLAWDGHALIAENGILLAESQRFSYQPQVLYSEIDLERLAQERLRQTTFGDAAQRERARLQSFRTVPVPLPLPRAGRLLPLRHYERFPYVPADPATRDQRCAEVFQIQVQGLAKRLQFTGIEKVVIGVSGGLDSTQALLVCAQTMDLLGHPRSNILAYTMPGFATTTRTLEQAHRLMSAIGCTASELDIRPSAKQMLRDLGHPYDEGRKVYDVTFENVQAGLRTDHLFRAANQRGGIVLGTGDLSEIALGWSTYGVGDQMSHYNVNGGVPKTLVQHLIRWVISSEQFDEAVGEVLQSVLDTEITPELVPATEDAPVQSSEQKIGPYNLQDFTLFQVLRHGSRPSKVAFLAWHAWHDAEQGPWPPNFPAEDRVAYQLPEIRQWLEVFVQRFFQFAQFKRSAIPNGPKVSAGGSLSPRGDWRAPSDSSARIWLDEIAAEVPQEWPT
jgi:NAD+ synthase (glutamine-hydrolysing)